MTPQEFAEICPSCQDPGAWAAAISDAAERFEIHPGNRLQHFLAQCCHECAGFTRFEENLNYSAFGLARTWPNRYATNLGEPTMLAHNLARKPEAIANDVYAHRMGNGDPASGDGWRYRGRGPIQITGKDMYRRCSAEIEIDILSHPEMVLVPATGALVAAWVFAVEKRCNELADADDIERITRRINGGLIGFVDRVAWHKRVALVV